MEEEHQQLQDLQHEGTLAQRRHLMPEKEWNMSVQYYQALSTALEAAIDAAIDALEEDADEDAYIEVDATFYNKDGDADEDDDEEDGEDEDEKVCSDAAIDKCGEGVDIEDAVDDDSMDHDISTLDNIDDREKKNIIA
jgi:hypothetical protein